MTGRSAGLDEPLLMLGGQLVRAQPFDLKPTAEMTKLTQPLLDPARREPRVRQPPREPDRIRRQRPRSRSETKHIHPSLPSIDRDAKARRHDRQHQ